MVAFGKQISSCCYLSYLLLDVQFIVIVIQRWTAAGERAGG